MVHLVHSSERSVFNFNVNSSIMKGVNWVFALHKTKKECLSQGISCHTSMYPCWSFPYIMSGDLLNDKAQIEIVYFLFSSLPVMKWNPQKLPSFPGYLVKDNDLFILFKVSLCGQKLNDMKWKGKCYTSRICSSFKEMPFNICIALKGANIAKFCDIRKEIKKRLLWLLLFNPP